MIGNRFKIEICHNDDYDEIKVNDLMSKKHITIISDKDKFITNLENMKLLVNLLNLLWGICYDDVEE